MKNIILKTYLLLFGIFSLFYCKPAQEESQAHINQLVQHTQGVAPLYDALQKAANDTSQEAIEQSLKPLKKELDKQVYAIKEVKNFDGSTKYRDKVLSFLLEVHSIADHEAQELSDLLGKRKEEGLQAKEKARLERLSKMMGYKYQVSKEHLQQALDEFADEYGAKNQ